MSKTHRLVQFATITTALLLAACTTTAAPTTALATPTTAPVQPTTAAPTAAPVQPTATPAATTVTPTTAAELSENSSMKVGLVTDTGGVSDHAFNQLAWEGVQKSAGEMGFQVRLIESQLSTDYETNIDALATEGYNVIITVGSSMGDATALKARQYPDIRFAIVDHAYTPTSGSQSCNETVANCYADGGLTNVTSLIFAEHQLGFLAGVLAGGMTRSGFVCSVTSVAPPASDRYVISFRAGAVWQGGEKIQGMNNYINVQSPNANIPSFNDSTQGRETAQGLIDSGCDVIFAVGGSGANGALLATQENNLMAIGADVDQYHTDPEVQNALLSSAQKNVDVMVYNYLLTVADGSARAGTVTGTLQNGGIGLAPFHNWDSRIPADLKARIQQAGEGIKEGSITIDLPQ